MEHIVGRVPLPDVAAAPDPAPGWVGESPVTIRRLQKLYDLQEQKGSNCLGEPELYIDFEEWPTEEDAAELCFGCPIRKACGAYAESTPTAWGIWGGKVYGEEI